MPSPLPGPDQPGPDQPAPDQPAPDLPSRRLPLALAAALLVLGTGVSLWAWQASAAFLARQADDVFERYSELSFNNIGQRVQHQLDLLAGFQALFRASTAVSREEFHSFFNDQRVQARFPGLLAVQYAQSVGAAERPAFEAAVRADRSIEAGGYPDFRIHPEGQREHYLVVTYTEPMRGNELAFGHDNMAEAARREVVERARDSGQPQASAPVMLLQKSLGVLVRLPLYRRAAPIETPAQRRAAYVGQISGALLLSDLLRDTLPSRGDAPFQVQVTDHGLADAASDGAPLPVTLVTRSGADATQALWAAGLPPPQHQDLRQHTLAMAGRVWTIQVARPPVDHRAAPFPVLLLAGGLSISLLLALLAARLSWLRHRAQRLALVMSQQARASAERLQAVFEHAAFALIVMDAQGVIQALNPAAERLLGCRAGAEMGHQLLASFLDRAEQATLQAMLQAHKAGAHAPTGHSRSIERTLHLQRRDGGRVPSSVTLSALHDNAGAVSGHLAIAYDISERQRLAEQLSQLAYHDGLTGLPNRLRLEDHLKQAIALAGRRHEPLALLFIDLDRFKPINDQHGHAVGDQVLCEVARRLQASLRTADLVARLGGDEFVVLLNTLAHHDDCLVVADKLMLALAEPMQIGTLTLQVGASMGVARYPEAGNTVAELLRSADAAMYQVKQAGRSTQPLLPLLPLRHQPAGTDRTDKPDPLPQS